MEIFSDFGLPGSILITFSNRVNDVDKKFKY